MGTSHPAYVGFRALKNSATKPNGFCCRTIEPGTLWLLPGQFSDSRASAIEATTVPWSTRGLGA